MSNKKNQETFAVGDLVDWDNKVTGVKHLIIGCGKGPFVIVSVKNIPTNRFFDRLPMRKSAGHHQWVVIAKDGNTVMKISKLTGKVSPQTWSGLWFKKV